MGSGIAQVSYKIILKKSSKKIPLTIRLYIMIQKRYVVMNFALYHTLPFKGPYFNLCHMHIEIGNFFRRLYLNCQCNLCH